MISLPAVAVLVVALGLAFTSGIAPALVAVLLALYVRENVVKRIGRLEAAVACIESLERDEDELPDAEGRTPH